MIGDRQTTIRDVLNPQLEEGQVEGTVERIVFESRDTGFVVARLQQDGMPGLVTFVGTGLPFSPGETVRLWGRWIEDQRFGRQLRVERFETIRPATADAIEKYLGSGLIDGIGPHFAKKLVAAFGIDTLRVIDEEPEKLRRVTGIGAKRAEQIRTAWDSQRAIQSIMLFLQGHGIPASQAARIYKEYGDTAVAILRDNPYRLAQDISGISFKTADVIASQLDIVKDSPKRIAAGIQHVLREATGDGHCYLQENSLVEDASRLLAVESEAVRQALAQMESGKQIVRERDAVFLPRLHAAEKGCDEWVKRIISVPAEEVPIDVERAITWVEKTESITLSAEQRAAISTAVASKTMVITGGPGTGKTTLLKGLLAIFSKKKLNLLLAAPTGRAAKRMSEATGRDAVTLHRLLEWSPKQGGFTRHEGNPLVADLVVVDECSMIDIYLMHSLLRALSPQCRLLLVGDVDQLPSVGPGNVLMDIIASGLMPVVQLRTVFRQAAESGIIANAHRVNTGAYPAFNDRDFFFIERTDPERALETIVEVVASRLPARFKLDPLRDIQVLAPMHRGNAGVTKLNAALRDALNPKMGVIGQRAFGLQDKVMQMRNNYELDVYNGDIGFIKQVNEDTREAVVEFDGRPVGYAFEQLDELSLAYASTVHKAQGSEYPAVVLPMLTEHYMMLQRNVLYTALTRASRIVVMVGDRKAIGRAVHNVRSTRRNTRLAERLRNTL
ncbi:MAG: ATP-dependent RecD-like DNA helicase [Candidatus Hydrogenedentes bacterium]|nr:ATP-dependent RecD-like DNA helicase [Candidatus Hydrogenedentota bacterium]